MNKNEILTKLADELKALVVGKGGKPNGHAVNKRWDAAVKEMEAAGVESSEAIAAVEAVARPFRR